MSSGNCASNSGEEGRRSDSEYRPRRGCLCTFFKNWKYSFRNLSLEQFEKLILITIAMNIVMALGEVAKVVDLLKDKNNNIRKNGGAVLSMIATVLTLWNIVVLVRLYRHPRPRAALMSGAIILCLWIIYVVQSIMYYGSYDNSPQYLPLVCVFLVLQLLSGWLLYRFWEFILFNYDDDDDISDSMGLSSASSGGNSQKRSGVLKEVVGTDRSSNSNSRGSLGIDSNGSFRFSPGSSTSSPSTQQNISRDKQLSSPLHENAHMSDTHEFTTKL